MESQIKEFDKAIAAQMELLPDVLTSIPGIGPVYAAGIMAEIGDINRFENHAQLAKYAGLAWTQYQSGGFEAQTVNRYQHKRALALTARKLVRLVFALLKDNRLYRPAK